MRRRGSRNLLWPRRLSGDRSGNIGRMLRTTPTKRRRSAVAGRPLMDPDEPQPIDQQIDDLVAVLLQEKPELDRARAHATIRETVERLLKDD